MRVVLVAFIGSIGVALAPSAVGQLSTGRALVSQSGVQYSVAPLDGPVGAAAFYSYGAPNPSCANTGLETPTISLVFLYQDTTLNPAPLSLFTINGDLPFQRSTISATSRPARPR